MLKYNERSYIDVLDFYCSDGYSEINSYLLGYSNCFQKDEVILLNNIIENINKLFRPADNDIILYRGITHEFSEGGQQCYVSTSKDKAVAKEFTSTCEVSYLLQIYVKAGQMIIDTELYDCCCSEREVILAINTNLRIIEKRGNIIICEVI